MTEVEKMINSPAVAVAFRLIVLKRRFFPNSTAVSTLLLVTAVTLLGEASWLLLGGMSFIPLEDRLPAPLDFIPVKICAESIVILLVAGFSRYFSFWLMQVEFLYDAIKDCDQETREYVMRNLYRDTEKK